MKKEHIIDGFKKYVPHEFAEFCANLLIQFKVDLKIKQPRNTKSGDYRPPQGNRRKHEVTINSNLKPYYFLLVYIHEMAHVKTWEDYGNKVEPHGFEWKQTFKEMMQPVLNSNKLPQKLYIGLVKFFIKTPATFIADSNLIKILRELEGEDNVITLEEIPYGTEFIINDLHLIKEEKLRTWFLCKDVSSERKFRVKGNAEVIIFRKIEP